MTDRCMKIYSKLHPSFGLHTMCTYGVYIVQGTSCGVYIVQGTRCGVYIVQGTSCGVYIVQVIKGFV